MSQPLGVSLGLAESNFGGLFPACTDPEYSFLPTFLVTYEVDSESGGRRW